MNSAELLPLVFTVLMGVSILAYVVLDGYDLGVGMLMPAAEREEQNRMVASIGPFWDANETWLVLGIGLLLVGFPVAHGEIGATSGRRPPQAQGLSRSHVDRRPEGHLAPLERRRARRAGEGDDRVRVETERRALEGALEPGGAHFVADDAVRQTERVVVHRTGGGHPDVPVADAPRVILNARLRPGLDDLDHRRMELEVV